MFTKYSSDLLRLSKNENIILNFLSRNKNSTVAHIHKSLFVPRMTVHVSLGFLKKRGLVNFSRIGKRRYWNLIEEKKLNDLVVGIIRDFSLNHEVRVSVNRTGFAIYHGLDALYKIWKSIGNFPKNTRIQIIQPTSSIKHSLNKLDWTKKVVDLQENILNKQIIIDGVLQDNYYNFLIDYYKNDPNLQKKVLKSFIGRSTDMTFISNKYFKNIETELIIFPNLAYIIDWKNEVAVEIKNDAMLIFLKELYELIKGYGKKIDQNKYILELISRLK